MVFQWWFPIKCWTARPHCHGRRSQSCNLLPRGLQNHPGVCIVSLLLQTGLLRSMLTHPVFQRLRPWPMVNYVTSLPWSHQDRRGTLFPFHLESPYTYVSSEHVVCLPKNDIIEQDFSNCIDSFKNQPYFLPFTKKQQKTLATWCMKH